MKISSKKTNRKKFLVPLLIALFLLAGYIFYAATTHHWPFDKTTKSKDSSDTSKTIQGSDDTNQPSSTKEQDYERSQKKNDSDSTKQGSTKRKNVAVNISTYSQTSTQLKVNGFVVGVVEDGGTCTLTLTDEGGKHVSSEKNAHANATNTTCGQSIISLGSLHSGDWRVELSYSSSKAKGLSGTDAMPPIRIK